MKQLIQSLRQLPRHRPALVLPLLLLPFTALLFWALGGGQDSLSPVHASPETGVNLHLPEASLKDGLPVGKLRYYQLAAADSARQRAMLRQDPYAGNAQTGSLGEAPDAAGIHSLFPADGPNGEPGEEQAQVYRKLEQLQAAMRQEPGVTAAPAAAPRPQAAVSGEDLDRLEYMMHAMQEGGGPDPEMQQVEALLERILDIQHPERVRAKIRQSSPAPQGHVLPLTPAPQEAPVSLLRAQVPVMPDSLSGPARQGGFYDWQTVSVDQSPAPNALQAVVEQAQTLVSGATVKLRLTQDVLLSGTKVPRGTLVFGTVSLEGERLKVRVRHIHYQQSLYPVELSAFDLDGLEGLHVPGAITREVTQATADRAVQEIGITALNPSLEVQAARLGVDAAKSLFRKKAKLVKATVPAGYRVLLLNRGQS